MHPAPTESREVFLSRLKDHRPALADFVMRCEKHFLDGMDRDTMKARSLYLMHSAKTQGYAAIHEAASALHAALSQSADDAALAASGAALHAACHEALVVLPSAPEDISPPNFSPEHKPSLLIADDDPMTRRLLTNMFKNDAEIITAENGREALEIIRNRAPDMVLLDDAMPEMTGLTLLETLQADTALRNTRVIMLTSSDRPQDEARARKAGVLDFVLKPFNPRALGAKVREALCAIPRQP